MIASSTLITISSWLGSKISDRAFDSIYSKISKDDSLNKKFYSVVDVVSKRLQKKYPDVLGGSIDYFFKREPVFDELFKMLFRISRVDKLIIEESFEVSTLPNDFIEEFILGLRSELLKDPLFDEILSNKELYIIFHGVGKDVSQLAKNAEISVEQLLLINKAIEQKLGSIFDFNEFFSLYKKNAVNNLSQVNFIGLGIDISIKKNRKNLQDVFVKPTFSTANKKQVKQQQNDDFDLMVDHGGPKIHYRDLLTLSDRLVVLGNPGAGKSVLVKSIICDILSQNQGAFKEKSILKYLPFRIELRKYLAHKKEYHGNILKYLAFLLEHEYQINNITEHLLDGILKSKLCLLFFDGLDEIFEITDKLEVKLDIENFHNSYPNVKSLTTSRIIGYEEANLNDSFDEVYVLNFDNGQIEEYVNRWYKKEEEIVEVRERECRGFLEKKDEIDQELITNPLLLSLIVIIYRNILKIPESKLEIYQSCTKTLVDKWDASKELSFDLDPLIYRDKDKLFADLAYWQYEVLSSKTAKVTYERAKKTISTSLVRLTICDDDLSDNWAEKFMIYAQKRSIYFEDNFTHKTFLEYYTAYWIYSNIEKKHKVQERDALISKYISNPFWFIVLELLLNMIDKDQADNDIIDELVSKHCNDDIQSLPFLLSVAYKLKNISPASRTQIISKSIEHLLNSYQGRSENVSEKFEKVEYQIFSGIQRLRLQEEALPTIVKELVKWEEFFKSNPEKLKTLYSLYLEVLSFYLPLGEDKIEFQLNKKLFESIRNTDPYLYMVEVYVFRSPRRRNIEKAVGFVRHFGTKELHATYNARFDHYSIGNYIVNLLHSLIDLPQNIEGALRKLYDAGLTYNKLIKYLLEDKTQLHVREKEFIKMKEILRTSKSFQTMKIIGLLLQRTEAMDRIDAVKIKKLGGEVRLFSRLLLNKSIVADLDDEIRAQINENISRISHAGTDVSVLENTEE